MGRLDSARSLRQHISTELELDLDVHLTPYPPIFGVQVGDFRTALAAHRAKKGAEKKVSQRIGGAGGTDCRKGISGGSRLHSDPLNAG